MLLRVDCRVPSCRRLLLNPVTQTSRYCRQSGLFGLLRGDLGIRVIRLIMPFDISMHFRGVRVDLRLLKQWLLREVTVWRCAGHAPFHDADLFHCFGAVIIASTHATAIDSVQRQKLYVETLLFR